MKSRLIFVFIALLLTVPASVTAATTAPHAAAVYQRNAGLWIVATLWIGNPTCYAASITQTPSGSNTYLVTVKRIVAPGVMCTQEVTLRSTAALFPAASKPSSVKIGFGTGFPALYSVGDSEQQK